MESFCLTNKPLVAHDAVLARRHSRESSGPGGDGARWQDAPGARGIAVLEKAGTSVFTEQCRQVGGLARADQSHQLVRRGSVESKNNDPRTRLGRNLNGRRQFLFTAGAHVSKIKLQDQRSNSSKTNTNG